MYHLLITMQQKMSLQALLWTGLLLLSTCTTEQTSMVPLPSIEGDYSHTMTALKNITDRLQHLASTGARIILDDCEWQLGTANEALTWAATQFPQSTLLESASFFRGAERAISVCNSYVSLRADILPSLVYGMNKHTLSTIQQMLSQLSLDCELVATLDKRVNRSIDINYMLSYSKDSNIVPSDSNDEDIQVCNSVHPTNCQFSACGKGRKLPLCVFGFASGVTGGLKGKSYVVTNGDDDPKRPSPGSLRYGVNQGGQAHGGIWITFAHSFLITLNDLLWIKSGTTIDGRGFNITITGRSMVVCGVTNVILHNFQISSLGESDTIHIFAGSTKVWVDHISSSDAKLGLVSVLQGSTDVTISNSHLSNYNFNMLLGASDFDKEDAQMRVSVYRNWFKDSMQRMPHCRWGKCHVLNNLYTNWGYYALGARANGKIYSEYNGFVASRREEVTPWFNGIGTNYDRSIYIRSSKDLLINGTTFHEFLSPESVQAEPLYKTEKMNPPLIPTNLLSKLLPPCVGAIFGHKLQQCSK